MGRLIGGAPLAFAAPVSQVAPAQRIATTTMADFTSFSDLRAALSRPAERPSRGQRRRRPARGHADQAAGQPRPAGGARRLAGALAGPRAAAARAAAVAGLRRHSWRDRARRLGLSRRSHRADGGEFLPPAAPPSTSSRARADADARASYALDARPSDRRFHASARR